MSRKVFLVLVVAASVTGAGFLMGPVKQRVAYLLDQRAAFDLISSIQNEYQSVSEPPETSSAHAVVLSSQRREARTMRRLNDFLTRASSTTSPHVQQSDLLVLQKGDRRYIAAILSGESSSGVASSSWWLIPERGVLDDLSPIPAGWLGGSWQGWGKGKDELIVEYALGERKARSYSVGKPVLDPADSARFTFTYEIDGEEGVVEGFINDKEKLVLWIVSGPLK